MSIPKLTPKQALFVNEYLIDGNATAAALRAGFKHRDIGRQLLTKSHVQQAIAKATEERSKRVALTADRVLQEIGYLSLSDARELVDDTGRLLPLHQLPEHVTRAISKVKTRRDANGDQYVEYTLWSKTDALKQAAAHLGMATERSVHSGQVSLVCEQRPSPEQEALIREVVDELARRKIEEYQTRAMLEQPDTA